MSKAKSIGTVLMFGVVYIALLAAVAWVSVRFTPWSVPRADIQLLPGISTSLQHIAQAVIGLPLFLYGAVLVQDTTAINHTAQNRTTRKPERLLTEGVYAVRRHPMYAGFICMQAGFWFGSCWLIGYLIGGLVIFIISMNSKREETDELEKLFPSEYARYKQAVPRRIYTPWLCAYLLIILGCTIISVATVGWAHFS